MDQHAYYFFQQQMEWLRERDVVLAKIEGKLRMMRSLATYRLKYELSMAEVAALNSQLKQLQQEIIILEEQLIDEVLH